jgi:two-component system, response regulator
MSQQIEILLVEDNECDAELIIRALKKHHFANGILHVKDGQEALDFLFGTGAYAGHTMNDQPKVVLLDVKLPKMDGLEVLRRIKTDEAIKMTPVVMLTSSLENGDLAESYKLRVNSYIVKPVDSEKFEEAIATLGLYWLLLNKLPNACANR